MKDHQTAQRAHLALDTLELLALGGKLVDPGEEEKRKSLLKLLSKVSHLNPGLFKDLIRKHREVLKQVLKLSAAEAAVFQHAARLTRYTRRQLSSGFIKVWGFNPFPSFEETDAFEAEVTKSFGAASLDRGRMPLYKSSKSKHTTMCYYARIRNLPEYLAEEVMEALAEEHQDPDSMRNLLHERYHGRLRLTFGGDKGGGTTKITIALGGGREPLLLGIFYGPDVQKNLELFLEDWTVQLRHLWQDGLVIRDPDTNEVRTMAVDLLVNGDMAFLSELLGHSGAAAVYPVLQRLIARKHLQEAHR